jgi:hypothetical protein
MIPAMACDPRATSGENVARCQPVTGMNSLCGKIGSHHVNGDPNPAHLFPLYSPALACEALSCKWRGYRVDACRETACPTRWAREAAEDRARREEKDAARRAEGMTGPPGEVQSRVKRDPEQSPASEFQCPLTG